MGRHEAITIGVKNGLCALLMPSSRWIFSAAGTPAGNAKSNDFRSDRAAISREPAFWTVT